MTSAPTDLVVAGAGPAGLATALYAARAGLRVVVLDGRVEAIGDPPGGPIDKACGEGLMPTAVRALAELGVVVDGRAVRGIRYTDGVRSVDAVFRTGAGLGVRRTRLQAALLDAVHAAGVPVVAEHVREVRPEPDGVRVDGRRARYLAAADGLHSPIRRRLGLHVAPGPARSPRWGVRRHFALAPWTDLVEVHWAACSEAYVTPVGPDLVGVAVLSGERRTFADHLTAFPALRDRLPEAGATSVRGAGPLFQRSRARTAGRVLLVGDAAGYVDALTGEGISVAFASARALVECVVADDPQAYERRWLDASRRYRWITAGLLAARRQPRLAPLIVPAAARLPVVFGAVVRQLAR